jgi:hypothetical protein
VKPQAISGARTIFQFNGSVIAAGFALSGVITTDAEEISGIDNVWTDELAPRRVSINMTCQVYRTPDNDPVVLGVAPNADASKSITSETQLQFAASKYISIEIRDKVTDKTIIFVPRAWIMSRAFSVAAGELFVETWTIKGICSTGPAQSSSLVGAANNIGNALGL